MGGGGSVISLKSISMKEKERKKGEIRRKERGEEKNGNGCTLSFYNGFWIYLVLDRQKRTDEGYLA